MKSSKEVAIEASVKFDGKASAHVLLNDASEYLQYACNLSDLMVELIHEPALMDPRRTSLTLEAIRALTTLGLQGTREAQERMA